MKKLKYFIPSILLMMIIFSFSNQTGSESSGLSSQIVAWFQSNLNISIPEIVIRKGAHMSEYALLTLTFIYAFYKNKFPIYKFYTYSLIACFAYACSDELHQLFIGGRAGQFTDVLIDTTGGIIIVFIIYLISKRKKSL
ncbi:MAG: VanZ family protein [Coprobacillus sp.]